MKTAKYITCVIQQTERYMDFGDMFITDIIVQCQITFIPASRTVVSTPILLMDGFSVKKTQCQWYPMKDVMIGNSRTNRPRVFKLGGRVGHVTRHV